VDFTLPLALGYTGLSDALLQKYIQDSAQLWQGQVDTLPIATIGSAVGTHVGPGAIAVAFFHAET
jgi:fatty acid-binding protein DegV